MYNVQINSCQGLSIEGVKRDTLVNNLVYDLNMAISLRQKEVDSAIYGNDIANSRSKLSHNLSMRGYVTYKEVSLNSQQCINKITKHFSVGYLFISLTYFDFHFWF